MLNRMNAIAARLTITAKSQFGCGFFHVNRSIQYHALYPAATPTSNFAVQAFFCQTLQRRMIPTTIHTPPLIAVTMGGGDAENSVNTFCQAMAVHRRKPFHADRINTNQYSRVTRNGGLFISLIFCFFEQVHQVFSAVLAVVFEIRRKLPVVWRKPKQSRAGKNNGDSPLPEINRSFPIL